MHAIKTVRRTTIANKVTAAKAKAKSSKAPKAKPAAVHKAKSADHVATAMGCENRGDWKGAGNAWRAAAQAAASRKDAATYTGNAASADVRAQASSALPKAAATSKETTGKPAIAATATAAPTPAAAAKPAEQGDVGAKPQRRAKGEGRKPREGKPFAHDPRVIPYIGKELVRVYTRKGETTERTATVKVLPDGFLYEGRHYRNLSKIAKEATGTGWLGLLFFGVVPYNRRERKGLGESEVLAGYHEAQVVFNGLPPAFRGDKLHDSLKEALETKDATAGHQHARRAFAAAAKLKDMVRKLEAAGNLLEVRFGKAVA
jgi:hypothetical protein